LQEDQTIAFQPMHDTFVPWHVRLFVLYLALIVLLAVLRSGRLVWILRTQRIAAKQSESFSRSQDFYRYLYVRTRSLKSLSHLTVLVSLISLLWSLADDLTQVVTQKTAGIGAVASALAEADGKGFDLKSRLSSPHRFAPLLEQAHFRRSPAVRD
jgi:hypothetical protein